LFFGRINTEGRERQLMAGSMLGQGAAMALVLFAPYVPTVALAMLVLGLATGPFDVTMFTLRQRRTDPAWFGRAFAVSMALNFAGFPIGSAIGGVVIAGSLAFALAAALLAVRREAMSVARSSVHSAWRQVGRPSPTLRRRGSS